MAPEGLGPSVIDGGVILAENGVITAIGSDIEIPPGAEVIDADGMVVTPGLVDAHTHLGVTSQGYPEFDQDCNEMMSGVTPHVRVIDAINPADEAFADALSAGVTCVQILPGSGNTIGGQGAIVKTLPDVVDRMVLRAPSSMKAAFGENTKHPYLGSTRQHYTRMGNAAIMRDAFVKALNYKGKKPFAVGKGEFFEIDLAMEALGLVIDGRLPVSAHAHRADDIATAIRIFEEFGLRYTIEHCTEGHLIKDWLAEKKAYAAVGPTLSERSKLELRNKSWTTPAELHASGVHVCIITDHGVIPIEHLKVCAALANAAGLPYMEALKAVTIYGAEHIGVDGRLGSLQVGKDADIAVWSCDPLDARSVARFVVVNGRVARGAR
ncbi:MAG: amidohydrolase [Synergistaceae bacterium]|jgi:imidazolonepropionase-like amidohydrolase|nr:amidohydrolase [Synergistaceae bacterium]